jgi:hypothetical protein
LRLEVGGFRVQGSGFRVYLEGRRCHVGLDVDLTSGLIPSRYKDLPFEKFVRLKSTTC